MLRWVRPLRARPSLFEGYSAIGCAGLLAAHFIPFDRLGFVCPFRHWLGFACASCGGTRAIRWLATGHPLDSLAVNPLVSLLGWLSLVGMGYLLLAPLRLPRIVWTPTPREGNGLRVAAVLLFLGNWAWLIARGV